MYKLIDKLQAPSKRQMYPRNQISPKSMVDPNFIRQFFIHSASGAPTTKPDPACMGLVSELIQHSVNIYCVMFPPLLPIIVPITDVTILVDYLIKWSMSAPEASCNSIFFLFLYIVDALYISLSNANIFI